MGGKNCALTELVFQPTGGGKYRRMKTTDDGRIQSQGRMLYTLLDATDDEGMLSGATAARWQEAKTRIICGETYEGEAGTLYALLEELAATGVLAGSWIDRRWRTLETGGEAN